MGKHVKTIFEYGNSINTAVYQELYNVEVDQEEVQCYYSSLKGISGLLKKAFPLLRYISLPTSKPSLAYIEGNLIPSEELGIFGKDTVIEKHIALPIIAVIPIEYRKTGICIYDSTCCILWDNIPCEIRHCHQKSRNKPRQICSHKPSDLLNKDPILAIIDCLQSTWHLYTEYRRFERTGEFDLDCHPHGGDEFGKE